MDLDGPPFICPACSSSHKTLHGVKIHIGKNPECKLNITSENTSTTRITTATADGLFTSISNDPQEVQQMGANLAALCGTLRRLRHIPKGARQQVSEALAEILENIVNRQDIASWLDLLAFPTVVLQFPNKSDKVTNLTSWVKTNVRNWFGNRRSALPPPGKKRNTPSQHSDVQRNKRVERKLADGDIQGAVRLLTSDDVLAPPSQASYETLQQKHPPHPEPTFYPTPPTGVPTTPLISPSELQEAIRSFHPGSAGGLDGLCPQALKDLTLDPSITGQDRLLQTMGAFIDLIISGSVPEEIRPVLFGATLISLTKKDGGVRPIAIGTTWRRLAAKIVCRRLRGDLEAYLSPFQLGVAVSCGAEIGAHAARVYMASKHTSLRACLKLDFRNAFNELRRDSMLQEVASFCPAYYPFIASCYDNPSHLYYGDRIILSQRGVQQGDPLGPALFALTLHPIVRSITSEFNAWYLDDGTIADSPETLLDLLPSITDGAASIGLHLQLSKCELLLPEETDDITRQQLHLSFLEAAPGIHLVPPDRAFLLGAPLSPAATVRMLEEKTEHLRNYLSRLKNLSSHAAFYLLRASFAIPRLIFFLRCASTWRHSSQLDVMDNVLRTGLESILNCSLSRQGWIQASLPTKNGGLGLRRASDLAIPAFLASWFHALPLVSILVTTPVDGQQPDVVEAMKLWSSAVSDPTLPSDDAKSCQKVWDKELVHTTFSNLLENATDPKSKARLLASSTSEAGAWLNALPSPQLGLLLENECFRIAVALRLGAPLCLEHQCPCGTKVDSSGLHGLACKRSAGRISRHASINDVLHRALTSANIPSILEPTGCDRTDGKRPDGATLVPWSRGRPLLWDFTCVDTFAQTYLPCTSTAAGAAAAQREVAKSRKYRDLMDRFWFTPVAIETAGSWGHDGLALVKDIGRRISESTQNPRATSHLFQRISVALQRGNAASVLGTLPKGRKLEELFF